MSWDSDDCDCAEDWTCMRHRGEFLTMTKPTPPEVPAPDEREAWLIEDKNGTPIKFATEMSYQLMTAMGWSVVRYVRAREGGR